jgi:hypothetical protein
MRVPALILVAALGLSLGAGVAEAEKVKSNQKTDLLTRPGERATVIVSVKSGTSMTLIAKEGRWLKVRVKGRTGYVPRSKVDMADDGDIARNTRRRPFVEGRGKKRGFGGSAPDDRVGADAKVDRGSRGDEDEEEEEEEEEAPRPKKVATKAKPPVKDEEEEDEEEDEAPPPKKIAAKATPKPPVKDDEEDEEEDEEEDVKPKAAAKKGGDGEEDEEEDEPKGKGEDKEADEPADTRRRVRVTKSKVSVLDDRDEESDERFVARPSDTLFFVEEKGGWTQVENADGDSGWVQSDLVEEGGGAGGSMGKRAIDVRARGGAMVLQQGLRTKNSTNPTIPDNYNVATYAVSIGLGGGILVPKGKFLIGGELTYDYSTPLGGVPIDLDGEGGNAPVFTGMKVHNVNVRGMFGLDLKKKSGMALLGRLGFRYQSILIDNVANEATNPARLPSEIVKGPTLGAALSIPMLTDKIGLRIGLDAMLFASSITQTKGLEDGQTPSLKAIVLGTGFTYRLKPVDILVSYDLNYMGIDFGAPSTTSMRQHMGTNVTRTDIFHVFTLGAAKGF